MEKKKALMMLWCKQIFFFFYLSSKIRERNKKDFAFICIRVFLGIELYKFFYFIQNNLVIFKILKNFLDATSNTMMKHKARVCDETIPSPVLYVQSSLFVEGQKVFGDAVC